MLKSSRREFLLEASAVAAACTVGGSLAGQAERSAAAMAVAKWGGINPPARTRSNGLQNS